MNRRKCGICIFDVHRASYVKHLRSKKHLQNEKLLKLIIPEWFFQEPIQNTMKKIYNPKSLKQIARDNFKLDDKQLKKELAKKMINPYYFTDKALKVGFKINLDTQYINHASSKLIITPIFSEHGIEVRYNNKIMKEFSVIYSRLLNQGMFKFQTVDSARFDKQDEDDQVFDEQNYFLI